MNWWTWGPIFLQRIVYGFTTMFYQTIKAVTKGIITERDIPEDQSIIWLFIKGQSVKATCDCTKTKSVFEIYYQDHKFSNKLWESLHPKTSLNRVLIFKYSYEDLFNSFKWVLNLYFTLSDVTICDDYCIKFYSKHIPDFT